MLDGDLGDVLSGMVYSSSVYWSILSSAEICKTVIEKVDHKDERFMSSERELGK